MAARRLGRIQGREPLQNEAVYKREPLQNEAVYKREPLQNEAVYRRSTSGLSRVSEKAHAVPNRIVGEGSSL